MPMSPICLCTDMLSTRWVFNYIVVNIKKFLPAPASGNKGLTSILSKNKRYNDPLVQQSLPMGKNFFNYFFMH
jgi:hypothetical protein